MSEYFPESREVSVKDVIGSDIELLKVVFMDNGKGQFGVFLASLGDEQVSFTTGAEEIMGACFKYFSQFGIRIEKEEIIEFIEPLQMRLIEKESRNGRTYISWENHAH